MPYEKTMSEQVEDAVEASLEANRIRDEQRGVGKKAVANIQRGLTKLSKDLRKKREEERDG